jgi:CheY-like chemotaxis protein
MLERLGCQVDAVADAEGAIVAIKSTPYDLVLMDHEMNGITGIQATRAIRELPHPMGSVPIVGCSGRLLPPGRQACALAGMNGQIGKPVTLSGLAQALAQFIPETASVCEASLSRPKSNGSATYTGSSWLDPALMQESMKLVKTELLAIIQAGSVGMDTDVMARKAHALLSTACVLGHVKLAQCCQVFEEAATQGFEVDLAFSNLKIAAEHVISLIDK